MQSPNLFPVSSLYPRTRPPKITKQKKITKVIECKYEFVKKRYNRKRLVTKQLIITSTDAAVEQKHNINEIPL